MIKLIFWIGIIATLVYFSGDLKYKDKSLKAWVSEFAGGDAAKTIGSGSSLIKDVDRLLNKTGDSLSDSQIKQVEKLIDERLSKSDRDSLKKLMQGLSTGGDKKAASKDEKPKEKSKSQNEVSVKKIAAEDSAKPSSQ